MNFNRSHVEMHFLLYEFAFILAVTLLEQNNTVII